MLCFFGGCTVFWYSRLSLTETEKKGLRHYPSTLSHIIPIHVSIEITRSPVVW